jgi:hypothetical protein
MTEKSGLVYIYNPEQASFYISRGVKLLDTGINKRTNKIWFKFGYYESSDAYFEWCTRSRTKY